MRINRSGSAVWNGGPKDGKAALSPQNCATSNLLEVEITFHTRLV